jgi:hypothetical protein
VAIQFHCEHCGKLVKAPDNAGGRAGRCPHCSGEVFIPTAQQDDADEIGLAPLDPEEERQRRQAAAEDAAYQRRLLEDKEPPPEEGVKPRKPAAPRPAESAPAKSAKHLNRLVVEYIESMSSSKLDRAAKLASELSKHRASVLSILDAMETEDLGVYGLPPLPRPILQGFLGELRKSL